MKKFITKIRNRRLKGNVSLLVIFILLACSVIALLSINQIQRLLTYWNMTFNYFRAFYLAKAWTELWLTEVYNSWDGFNQSIESGNVIVSWNLLPEYSWFNPYFNMTISWSFYTLNDDIRSGECLWNEIKLATWDGIMLSLFSDVTDEFNRILSDDKDLLKLEDIANLSLNNINNNNYELTFAVFTYRSEYGDEFMEDIIVYTWLNLSVFLNKSDVYDLIKRDTIKKYLTIKNSWDEEVKFCITKNKQLIPYSNSLITVRGNYGDMEVGLQSIVKKSVPSRSLNVLE